MDEWKRLHESVDNLKQELIKVYEPHFDKVLKIISRVINGIFKQL